MAIRELLLFGSIFLATAEAPAVCLDGRHPTPQEEFRSSGVVVIGRVLDHSDLKEDSTDPDGLTATVYRIEVFRHFKGSAAQTIQVRSENTSSRFPMEAGEDYLLFLNEEGRIYSVDSCGNSAPLKTVANVVAELGAKK
jgi:hypothetical protein